MGRVSFIHDYHVTLIIKSDICLALILNKSMGKLRTPNYMFIAVPIDEFPVHIYYCLYAVLDVLYSREPSSPPNIFLSFYLHLVIVNTSITNTHCYWVKANYILYQWASRDHQTSLYIVALWMHNSKRIRTLPEGRYLLIENERMPSLATNYFSDTEPQHLEVGYKFIPCVRIKR